MRKPEREVKNADEAIDILDRCETIRIGLYGPDYPYVVPMSFGYEFQNDQLDIYVHGAKEGLKHELIAQNNKVCAEADIFHRYAKTGRGTTTDYESFIGFGTIETAGRKDAVKGIDLLLKHCKTEGSAANCIKLGITTVYKIHLDSFTGKKRFAE